MEINEKVVNTFKAFGDETRLKIINLIMNEPLSVSAISEKINASQSAVSHQLHILKLNGICKRMDLYCLYNPDCISFNISSFALGHNGKIQ